MFDDPIPTSVSDDDCPDTVQSPPTDRGDSGELPQWTDVGVVVHPRPPDHAHQEDRVSEVHFPPDSTADAEGVATGTNMIHHKKSSVLLINRFEFIVDFFLSLLVYILCILISGFRTCIQFGYIVSSLFNACLLASTVRVTVIGIFSVCVCVCVSIIFLLARCHV